MLCHLIEYLSHTVNDCNIWQYPGLAGNFEGHPRHFLVPFDELDMRNSVWSKKTALKGSSIVMSEFLTRQSQAVFLAVWRLFWINNIWTVDGNINVKLPSGEKQRLTTSEQLSVLTAFPCVNSGVSREPVVCRPA